VLCQSNDYAVTDCTRYILREQRMVQNLSLDDFFTGNFKWGEVPDFKNIPRTGIRAGQGPGREWTENKDETAGDT